MNQTRVSVDLLGGKVEIVAYDLDPNHGAYILENIHLEGIRLEKIFNFYDKDSEISKLNRERKINPSSELFEVLEIAGKFAEKYPNYNPFLGENIVRLKKNEEPENIDFSFSDIIISRDLIELKNPKFIVDLGSVAKGYIADKLIEEMKAENIASGFIDARGDLVTFGEHYEIVEIPSPRNNSLESIGIKLENLAIATSGNETQGSHILNEGAFENISIISKSLVYADLFSTICFTMELEEIKKFAEENEVKIYAVSKNEKEFDFNGFLDMERKIKIKDRKIKRTRSS